ncbi:arylesterase [Pedobacter cryoconitis]|uniref:Acyl-CoA thioesterase-1 n=1 Tax=Pedobacter cryoconitis TaxID=188932 RepID=A0A7X0MMY6_9SPHI|nr:arylesterase [Pedobacter cryoconitis]MBB6502968.1 acyl-CoA thioesterase-1 [Pedobacter cryoconitis]
MMIKHKLRYNYIVLILLIVTLAGCGSAQKPEDKTAVTPLKDTTTTKEKQQTIKNILFFGTSLTAGLGVDPDQAFPALIQKKIDSLHLPYKVINAGLSGETSAAGKSRISWLLKQRVDVFVLELGANDGLRGIPVQQTADNLQAIVDKVKQKYPQARMLLTGMQMPPSMGERYTHDFSAIFPALAKKNKMDFLPFLLKGVGGIARLNQKDGIHPTPEGHRILAENVWQKLQAEL